MEKAAFKTSMISRVVFLVICVAAGAEAAKAVQRCNSNADCKTYPCTSDFVLCVDHVCTCEVANAIRDVAADCRSLTDCRDTAEDCPKGRATCHNGKCLCFLPEFSQSGLQIQNDQCSVLTDCKGVKCAFGTIKCVDGECKCVDG
ncbi:hypothetical protein D8674_016046 [Pyrus ussuriensis x Pyrus communis]|uniref:Uncharacterized protein n=1 Tax=Pyrus ussuriensis x Pyrus communis TaxID=2448454 RepID=A0A5N5H8Q0_9ROSA|nr:hypothetical protein D8674_016046 [Pyrus ussuriensis x Pyrus communis]